tara:strand:+ start:12647 stop:13081 length:435 start_codon:yes stop_codon:yes gene_type:complete
MSSFKIQKNRKRKGNFKDFDSKHSKCVPPAVSLPKVSVSGLEFEGVSELVEQQDFNNSRIEHLRQIIDKHENTFNNSKVIIDNLKKTVEEKNKKIVDLVETVEELNNRLKRLESAIDNNFHHSRFYGSHEKTSYERSGRPSYIN